MERITETVYPDGRRTTITEKSGIVFRDLLISGAAAIGAGFVAGPVGVEVAKRMPVATNTVEKIGRTVAVASATAATEGLAMIGIEHTLNEIVDLGDEAMASVKERAAKIIQEETKTEVVQEEETPEPKKNVSQKRNNK